MRFFNNVLRFGPSDDDNVTQTFEPPLRQLDTARSNTSDDEEDPVTSSPVGILRCTLEFAEAERVKSAIESMVVS